MANKNMPVGVKILSVLEYIGSGLGLLFGLALIIGGSAISSMLPGLEALGTTLFVILGLFVIALAVLQFFIARGLWRGQNWARIVVIIFSCLGVLFSLIGLFGETPGQSVFSLLLNGLIGGYLLFAKEVKTAFA